MSLIDITIPIRVPMPVYDRNLTTIGSRLRPDP
jgi:hypothetical protein